ncbi:serine hydrolase domain-containing protein [Microbacterium sp. M3]|uniref:Serine hydrolase domain-containing protein n=1 Tax=Microbacterium arthrosphaerae TaxID=792652 RepID=A0ABU4GWY0_9MICO|nr:MULTISPECIES: serine hydrolase domain-containing protein [Microbacterium]MDW4571586.1 serine hydrolase domain-containing protein [Microbacterium arthrosphaerae]MDW7605441.1 serine hydrolase domain-containing protein [Microbacterium sp. M3]
MSKRAESSRPGGPARWAGTTVLAAAVLVLAGCAGEPALAPSAEPTASDPAISRPAAPEGELSPELQDRLQQTVDETMAEYGVPGAAVGVWIPEQGSWTSAAGIADLEGDVPVTTDMQWPLRSITKSYTVTLLLQLVDEGLLSLDESIGQYVDGVTDGEEITLRQLANMSSGNADYTKDAFVEAFSEDPERIFTLDELNGFMLGEPAQFAPGARKVYTNANTNLLGATIEAVTGEEFADVLWERILEPLGQDGTEYNLDVATWSAPHPVGYAPVDGGFEPQADNLSVFGPAGSMVSSLDDARVWGEILATGAMLQPETQAEREEGAPLEVGPPYDLYALGMGETGGWWGHNGEGFGFTAAVFHEPETGATIAVFTNVSNLADRAHPADQMFRRLAAVVDEEK